VPSTLARPFARSTPTRVGKTGKCPSLMAFHTVHPHARGENESTPDQMARLLGPPPRAWGKLLHHPLSSCVSRSTPTRVGKTICTTLLPVKAAVHPHARGENIPFSNGSLAMTGPPPRAWGKRQNDWPVPARVRSTPTRVGKTFQRTEFCHWHSVHPHARGENVRSAIARPSSVGPPPRAWGKRLVMSGWPICYRSTPTRVGKTGDFPA